MPLAPGTRLGPYEVVGLLGAGGMGEVFRARDHRLRRDVALKVLPALRAADPDHLARFEREAQLLAALSHPNIAAIHGIEEGPSVNALVLELVEGQTLEERLNHGGAIPFGESIRLARQLVAALEAAHGSGIIHRDLKPSNIKLRPDGTLKVLDFGLARALEPAPAATPGPDPSTVTSAGLTREGTILGTTPYMSPEQARGLAVDRRTDIWAFGCVLYEMLTGRRAFPGRDVSETIALVLTRDPDWTALPAGTPAPIRRLLRRCLAKDHSHRLADIADARLELDDADGEPPAPDGTAPVARRERIAWATGLALLAALSAAALLWPAQPQPDAVEMRADIVMPPSTDPTALAISPDGQRIVFVGTAEGRSRLWLRTLTSQEPAQPLPGTDDARLPFWSPDGRSIGFGADARLKRIDLEGGSVRSLAIAPVFLGGSWNADGDILFVPFGNGPVMRIPADGGDPVGATQIQPGESHHSPHFLPDGRHFLYYLAGPPETSGIHLARLHQGGSRRLLPADTGGLYAAGDAILFTRRGALLAQRFDPRRLELVGEALPVAENIGTNPFAMAVYAAVAASVAGPIVYRVAPPFPRVQLTWYDRAGQPMDQVAESPIYLLNIALSPDNQRVAAFRVGDIWMFDLREGKGASRFTFENSVEFAATWSPDSSRLAISSNRHGVYDLFEKPATGAGAERPLLVSPENTDPTDWSPDGAYLLYRSVAPPRAYDIYALELATGNRFPLVQTDADERDARFSPDGRWIAYQSNESGRFEVWVQPFSVAGDGRAGKWQISTGGGGQVLWNPNPRVQELFYLSADSRVMSVRIRETPDGTGIDPEAPQALFAVPGMNFGRHGTALAPYGVSRDGQRFLFTATPIEPTTSPLTLLLNWRPDGTR